MFIFPTEEEHKIRLTKVKCSNRECNGIHISKTDLMDWSPRIESSCNVCNAFMSVKLSSIDADRIISVEVVEEEN